MTVQIIRGTEVNRPTPERLKSTILDHATIGPEQKSFGSRNNEGLWPSYNCLDTAVPTELCPDPTTAKTFGQAGWQPSFEFAVYGGVYCAAMGLDEADMKAEITRVFERNEAKGVEAALLATRFVADASGNSLWGAPTDITPVAPVSPATALALLEGYAASVYAGVPTIHMPRAMASYLGERIKWDGDKAYTRSGAKIAMGGGYDTDTVPAPTEWDIYATGEVFVEKSEMVDVNTFSMGGQTPGVGVPEYLHSNTVLGLAERMFRVGVDCFVARATGTVGA